MGRHVYTEEQRKWLKNNYFNASWNEIDRQFPGIPRQKIMQLAYRLGLKRNTDKPKIKNPKDIIGNKYGKLTVVEYKGYIFKNKSRKDHVYLCKCDCGNYTEVIRHSLVYGITKSCGCLHKETIIKMNKKDTNYEKHHIRSIRKHMKSSAKQRGYIFDLSYDDVKELVTQPCYYCGSTYSNCHRSKSNEQEYGAFYYNGIDRVDNDIGYIKDNVVSCCATCNRAKSTMSQTEFYNWIQKVSLQLLNNKVA